MSDAPKSSGRSRDRRGGEDRRGDRPREQDIWKPLTRLGEMVKGGKLTSIEEIYKNNYIIKEKEIVDYLVKDLKEEVIDIKLVQKQTDAGEKNNFKCTVVVGNSDGYIGIASAKNREVGPGIRKSIAKAKLAMIPVKRGCGSWECKCGGNHSIPFEVTGKMGSVSVVLKPAPRGTGLACSDTAKNVLKLAGISDIWIFTKGNTRCRSNMAKAVGFSNAVPLPTYPLCRSYNPQPAVANQVWAPPLSLATTHGILSSPPGT